MAHTIRNHQQLDFAFRAVDHAVGDRAPNREDDTMLVQFLLQRIYAPRANKPFPGSIVVDGKFGPTTRNWIQRFQWDTHQAGRQIALDKRVDPATADKGSISGTTYTIIHLNAEHAVQDPTAHLTMEAQPGIPPRLRAALLRTEFQGTDIFRDRS
jgi:hypothetical protein